MMLDVDLSSFCMMVFRLRMMGMGEMSMMASLLVVTIFVMLGCFAMMFRRMFVMHGSVCVMLGGFLRV